MKSLAAKLARSVLRLFWWGLAGGLVGMAILISVARMLLPGMTEYRHQIEALVSQAVERPVRIGGLSAAWYRFWPVLRLRDVTIEDAQLPGGRLDVGEVQLGLDLAGSALAGEWRMAGIRVIGVQLRLDTDIASLPPGDAGVRLFNWLMRQGSVVLEDIDLVWRDPLLPVQPLQLQGLRARLLSDGWRHQFLVEAAVNAAYADQVRMAADFRGPLGNPQAWRGRLYAQGRHVHLQRGNPYLRERGYRLSGNTDFEVWARLKGGRLRELSGHFEVGDFLAARQGRDEAYRADRLGGHFRVDAVQGRAAHSVWNLRLQDLYVARGDEAMAPAGLRLRYDTGESLGLRLALSRLDLAELTRLAVLLPEGQDALRHRLRRMRPRGHVRDLRIDWYPDRPLATGLVWSGNLEDLSFSPDAALPGVARLRAHIEGGPGRGRVMFDTRAARLSLPRIFSRPLALDRLTGTLEWQTGPERWSLSGQRLRLVSGPLVADARLGVQAREGQPPWIDLQIAAPGLPMERVRDFLPDRRMKPKLHKWLAGAFQAGEARDLRFLLQGPLDRLPFDQGEGRMEARFSFADTRLDYHPLWGRLEQLDGRAHFDGRHMEIEAERATLLDARVERVVARIDNLARAMLEIEGTVSGTLEALLAYIEHSPLKARFGSLVERIRTEGDARLQLGLKVPLAKGIGTLAVEGELAFSDNLLQVVDSDVRLQGVQGRLQFTRHEVRARDIRAQLYGVPVTLAVYPEGEGDGRRTLVQVDGRLPVVEKLATLLPATKDYLQGNSHWQARLALPMNRSAGPIRLALHSDLQGIAIHLPTPLGKTAEASLEARIGWVPGQTSTVPVEVSLGARAALKVLLPAHTDASLRVGLHLGEGAAALPAAPGLRIDGRIEHLDLDAWIATLREAAARGGEAPGVPLSTRLDIGRVSLFGYAAGALALSSEREDPWLFHVTGRDMEGEARWRPATAGGAPRLELRLERLFALPEAGGRAPPARERVSALTPERLPDLDFDIASLRIGARELGHVQLRGRRVPEGVEYPLISVDCPAIVLTGKASWLRRNDSQATHIEADIQGGELGRFIRLAGGSATVEGGKMKGRVVLDWTGNPGDFSLATVEGELKLKTGKGRLNDVKEGAGKLLNLISLGSLQRRLALDFSDLTKEGFAFDQMKGHFVLMDGNAYTEDFEIRGSSAIIRISGRTGLAARDYDQLVKVVPQLSSGLPLAGVIAGGPAVGAAVLLAERLVGKEFNRQLEVRYRVTGTWDAPVYERLKPPRKPPAAADEAAQSQMPGDDE
ncbi:MAG TPA: TIGR02099 family protein [Gammaproteobacteria bacterium]|nr:TIGR02099 family protein [Gammaproteobacteria bacterium]